MTSRTPGQPPRLSVVIPVKDERESVPVLADELDAALANVEGGWEAIWVDDGSSDGSLEVLRELSAARPGHRYVSMDGNQGQSAALLAGFRAARGELIGTLDADLQNDPADLPVLLHELDTRDVDLVNGVRARRHDSFVRKASSRIANAYRNLLTRETVSDVGCSLRVFRRRFADPLPPFRGMHRFLPTLLRLNGARVAEVPVGHRPRQHGHTKYGVHNRLWVGILDTFGVRWLMTRWARTPVRETSETGPAAGEPEGASGELGEQ